MENPKLIATLIPVDGPTEYIFSNETNKARCLPPTRGRFDEEGPAISSREPTPACALSWNDDGKDDLKCRHRLLLNFDEPPKDPAKGYAFGTDEKKCDVVLAPRGARGISGVHFHITFDVIRGERRLVLRDSSTNGSAVSYSGQAEHEVRHKFPWILNLEKDKGEKKEGKEKEEKGKGKKEGEWKLKIHVRGLEFKVELTSHRTCEVDYEKNVTKFLKLSRTADPPLGGLSIDSYMTEVMPSQSRTPGQRPIYIREDNLGKGAFGQVDRVVDVSTGAIYARKTFHEPSWAKNTERRKLQREKWLNRIRREIRIMREHPHVSIIIRAGETDADHCERNIWFRLWIFRRTHNHFS